jgi:hypothetical protein
MNELQDLSDDQLKKMIESKSKEKPEAPDYSQQYKRDWTDTVRDAGYGFAKGIRSIGKDLENLNPLQDLEAFPKSTGNFMDNAIESMKSPYPSPGGDLAQTLGEFAIPIGGVGRMGAKVAAKGISKLPKITKKGMSGLYTKADEIAATEGASGLLHDKGLINDISSFFKNHKIPGNHLVEGLKNGEHEATRETRNILGKINRDRDFDAAGKISADLLRNRLKKSHHSELTKGGFENTRDADVLATENYAKAQGLKDKLSAAMQISGSPIKYGLLSKIMNL